MVAEFAVGRRSRTNGYRAFPTLGAKGAWKYVGFLCVLTGWLILCYYGVGVPVDRKKAVKWWTMAAKLGNTMAANCLKNPLFPNDVEE